MNDSFSRFMALLAVWVLALMPLLLLDGQTARLAATWVGAQMVDLTRP